MTNLYVQYGCGLSAPSEWTNFDVSPTLRIQKLPILGALLKTQLNTSFPSNVLYGNIIEGLPLADNSCDGVYCSHTLEHLSLQDFRISLQNTYKILKKGGTFRCVLPDLEYEVRNYIKALDSGDKSASIAFMESTLLGVPQRAQGMKAIAESIFGNSHHLWMWDHQSLAVELANIGFTQIRNCQFNDSADAMFKHVESAERFQKAVAIECVK